MLNCLGRSLRSTPDPGSPVPRTLAPARSAGVGEGPDRARKACVMLNGSCGRLVSRRAWSIGRFTSQGALPVKHLGCSRGAGMLH